MSCLNIQHMIFLHMVTAKECKVMIWTLKNDDINIKWPRRNFATFIMPSQNHFTPMTSFPLPEAQFPSAIPPPEEQASADWQLPYITVLVVADDKVVHWLKLGKGTFK